MDAHLPLSSGHEERAITLTVHVRAATGETPSQQTVAAAIQSGMHPSWFEEQFPHGWWIDRITTGPTT